MLSFQYNNKKIYISKHIKNKKMQVSAEKTFTNTKFSKTLTKYTLSSKKRMPVAFRRRAWPFECWMSEIINNNNTFTAWRPRLRPALADVIDDKHSARKSNKMLIDREIAVANLLTFNYSFDDLIE